MAGEASPIYVGMPYGTVTSKMYELLEKAKENNTEPENFEFKPYKKRTYKVTREAICFKDNDGKFNSLSKETYKINGKKVYDYKYDDGIAQYFGYNRTNGDETFDTIVADRYIAHDRNHNGIVDEDEIESID